MDDSFKIIAIGASAGGQQALLEFFSNLGPEPNSAFIVVTHLSRDYPSRLDVILSGVSPIPTVRIRNGLRVENNHLYVTPEGVIVTIKNGSFVLTPRSNAVNRAVDQFFFSLADDQKDRAIAIIMSGSGTDGTAGTGEIHKRGGKVFIQSPNSASFESMPKNAIVHDHPDVIASPAMLAKNLGTLLALK